MPATRATIVQQRQEMAHLADGGLTYRAIAKQIGVSVWTVRKWVRRARQGGLSALVTHQGRPATGPMSDCDPLVRYVTLRLKRQHLTWGAAYVVKKMGEMAMLAGKRLPGATTVWRYWRTFGDRLYPRRSPPQPKASSAEAAHEVWQMDARESISVPGVGLVTFNQARDEFGRATVMHRIHVATESGQPSVKLTGERAQHDCRIAFTQWGLPDVIQTDRDPVFFDNGPSPFPARVVLWWKGLGIKHRLLPRNSPQRNGCVERSHRTLNERTLTGRYFEDASALQAQVDVDWHELDTECPSRARGCYGQPPLVAHPELLVPRRPYRPEWELDLFDLHQVDAYLATFTWLRTATSVGQVSVGKHRYSLGQEWAEQPISVTFDPESREFVFTQVRAEAKQRRLPELLPVRRKAHGLAVEDLTGLPTALQSLPQRQLMFPLLMCYPSPSGIQQGV